MIITGDRSLADALGLAGREANGAAARSAFADYRSRKAKNTLRNQDADLATFSAYLLYTCGEGPTGEALASIPKAWDGITWGLVDGFVKWLVLESYAIGTVNLKLSTVKTYARLAAKVGVLDRQEMAMIRAVQGFTRKEGKRIDEQRAAAGIPTRSGSKKAEWVAISPEQAAALRDHPNTPQGRRDRLLMCLLLDHGLRAGEVVGLAVGDIDLEAGELQFYREKVDKTQKHRLTPATLDAARAYLEHDGLALGPLLRSSRKGGELTTPGMTTQAITGRVHYLGKRAGIEGLSAHDLRHHWVTAALRAGTPIDRLQDAGGWASPAMPLRYVKAAAIANEGVKLE